MHAAVGDDRQLAAGRAVDLAHRLQLRHAGPGLQPRAAAAAGADADLDRVGPAVGERAGGLARSPRCRRRAARRAKRWRSSRDRGERDVGVGVGDVEQQHVHLLLDERRRALEEVAGGADRGAHAQAAARVLGRVRLLLVQLQVAHRDEAAHPVLLVDERQLLDAMLEHRPLGLLERHRGRAGHQPLARRHEVARPAARPSGRRAACRGATGCRPACRCPAPARSAGCWRWPCARPGAPRRSSRCARASAAARSRTSAGS